MEIEELKLQALQKLLSSVSLKAEVDIVDSNYNRIYKAFCVIAKEQSDLNVRYISNRVSAAWKSYLKDQPVGDPFRVCSVGCGDGERDCGILREALKIDNLRCSSFSVRWY